MIEFEWKKNNALFIISGILVLLLWTTVCWNAQEHSVEEVLERPTGYPKVGGSNHGSGDFSLQPQRNPYLS